MFFAIADYQNYKRRTGRFSRDFKKSIMGGAFEGSLPETALRLLQPGDILFIQTLGRPLSWLIMYLTKAEVSHVAMCVSNREIAHATLAGVCVEPIEALFHSNTHILPCIWPMPDDKRLAVDRTLREQLQGVPYGWLPALLKGLRILTGRDWPCFRWAFFADISFTIFLLDLPFLLLLQRPVLSWLVATHLALIALNAAFWRFKPLQFSEWTGKPIDMLRMLQSMGGHFIFDAFSIYQQSNAHSTAVECKSEGGA